MESYGAAHRNVTIHTHFHHVDGVSVGGIQGVPVRDLSFASGRGLNASVGELEAARRGLDRARHGESFTGIDRPDTDVAVTRDLHSINVVGAKTYVVVGEGTEKQGATICRPDSMPRVSTKLELYNILKTAITGVVQNDLGFGWVERITNHLQRRAGVRRPDPDVPAIIHHQRIHRIAVCGIQGMPIPAARRCHDRSIRELETASCGLDGSVHGEQFARHASANADLTAAARKDGQVVVGARGNGIRDPVDVD
jgi:hypothetical protein